MLNPCPEQVGGEPTRTSKAYGLIRRAVGTGGSAANDLGLEGLWRRSKAHGLAAATSSVERAVVQSDPHLATDFLPYYERVLGIVPAASDAQATRAEIAGEQWTRTLDASVPNVGAELVKLDPRFSIVSGPWAKETTTVPGRAFAPNAGIMSEPAFGSAPNITPNYATSFVVRVLFTLGYPGGVPNAGDARILARAREKLLDLLPSWVAFSVVTDGTFNMGDPCDLTSFGA